MGATHRLSRAAGITALVMALGPALLFPVPAGSAAVSGKELALGFEQGSLATNTGNAALAVGILSANGGWPRAVAGRGGTGTAVRMPAYSTSNEGLTAFRVRDTTGADDLTPYQAGFSFGADFTVDTDQRGADNDNGNNLIQRGRYTDPMQYKLQVDGGRVSCRIKGRSGELYARTSWQVVPNDWYRVVCSRSAGTLTLVVTHLSDGVTRTLHDSGTPGSLYPTSRSIALSVGAKLAASGSAFASGSADEFNGKIDNVFVDIAS